MSDPRHLGNGLRTTSTQSRFAQSDIARVHRYLTTSAVATSTSTAYIADVTRYHSHCAHRGRHSSAAQLDRCMEEYICHLFLTFHGRCRQRAVNTVYGLYMLRPVLRGRLRGSEALLAGWQRVVPSVPHPPLTWPLTIAIARTMAGNGYGECAVATLVAFDGLLRVGELVRLTVADISLPQDSRRGSGSRATSSVSFSHPSLRQSTSAFIRIAVAKTGTNQTAEIRNPDVISLLRQHMATRHPTAHLFDFACSSPVQAANHFRSLLRTVCSALDISSHGFTPHSLRHGGATHANMHMGETIEHVLHRGRWQSNSSARIYLQSGAAALISSRLSEQAQRYVRGLRSHWVAHLEADCFTSDYLSC